MIIAYFVFLFLLSFFFHSHAYKTISSVSMRTLSKLFKYLLDKTKLKKLFTKPDLHAYERVKNRQKKAHTHRHLSIVAIFRKSFQNNDDEINKKLEFLFLKPYDERQFKRFDTLSSLHLTKKNKISTILETLSYHFYMKVIKSGGNSHPNHPRQTDSNCFFFAKS